MILLFLGAFLKNHHFEIPPALSYDYFDAIMADGAVFVPTNCANVVNGVDALLDHVVRPGRRRRPGGDGGVPVLPGMAGGRGAAASLCYRALWI